MGEYNMIYVHQLQIDKVDWLSRVNVQVPVK